MKEDQLTQQDMWDWVSKLWDNIDDETFVAYIPEKSMIEMGLPLDKFERLTWEEVKDEVGIG
jgi:hypothetical protein